MIDFGEQKLPLGSDEDVIRNVARVSGKRI
jgi:hypothetical protein